MCEMEVTDEDKARIVAVADAAARSIITLGLSVHDGRHSVVALQAVVLAVVRAVFEDEQQQKALTVLMRQIDKQLVGGTDSIGPTKGTA